MKASTKDQAAGKFHEVKGKVKEMAGHLTNNPDLEADGTAEKLAGKDARQDRPSREGLREVGARRSNRRITLGAASKGA